MDRQGFGDDYVFIINNRTYNNKHNNCNRGIIIYKAKGAESGSQFKQIMETVKFL